MLASEFDVLIERYEQEPGLCSKLLRTHALTEPKQFLEYAAGVLLERPASRALKFITNLALSAGLIEYLLAIYGASRKQALALAQKALACEPTLDKQILEFLRRPVPNELEEIAAIQVGLDILSDLSTDDRLVPGVLKLLKHASPKVRSKAALFIGNRTQNLAWAANLTKEYDARVRANILESLFGINSEFVLQMFRSNVADDNCRIAGNAVLGLYLLGDVASVSLIHQMVKHPEARFRNTGAWLMGRTHDPRFSTGIAELINDPDELVRKQAFKALGEIRKTLRKVATGPQLQAAIVDLKQQPEPSLIVTVQDEAGQSIRQLLPTSFILKTGAPTRTVQNYTVEEHEGRASFSVCFLMCLPPREEQEADASFIQTVQSCRQLRRPKDKWAVAKISSTRTNTAGSGTVSEDNQFRSKYSILNVDGVSTSTSVHYNPKTWCLEYSFVQERIDGMLRESPFQAGRLSEEEAAKTAAEALLKADGSWGNLHWILFGASSNQSLVKELLGRELNSTVHVLAQSPAWQNSESKTLADKTGGIYREVSTAEELRHSCLELYSSLSHHYRISWKEEVNGLELDVYSELGRGSVTYARGSASCSDLPTTPVRLTA